MDFPSVRIYSPYTAMAHNLAGPVSAFVGGSRLFVSADIQGGHGKPTRNEPTVDSATVTLWIDEYCIQHESVEDMFITAEDEVQRLIGTTLRSFDIGPCWHAVYCMLGTEARVIVNIN
jgi:hypothetical protein